jgi:DNA-binding MarR family transcriptional regulator
MPDRTWATVGELAGRLQASPHGTAALVKRCEQRGFVVKRRSRMDARCVEVHLTAQGRKRVARVAALHRQQLRALGDTFRIRHITGKSRS